MKQMWQHGGEKGYKGLWRRYVKEREKLENLGIDWTNLIRLVTEIGLNTVR
jgi:hypothetical protein